MGPALRGTGGNGARGGSDGLGAGREGSPAPGTLDTAPDGPEAAAPAHRRPGVSARIAALVRDYLPRGNTLDEATFQRRHLLLCWILALHVPGLFILGLWLGFTPLHLSLELLFPAACVVFARKVRNRRLAAFFTTAGLVYCSSILVHLSGGMIEAHFHFFILIGLIALYQDWVPFLWDVVFTILSHGIGSAIGPTMMFDHGPGQRHPWTWALIHGLAVLAACVGEIIFWKNTEDEQRRNVALVANLAAAETEKQQARAQLLVNLARRNQSLINRQLEVIGDLEGREEDPDTLEDVFRLDHLATRIRRNAESLLVLSGDDPPRRWGSPVALTDVVRAAAAEVEDYQRVDVLVDDHLDVAGRAVADLAHLLAELIENAATFSPPTTDVRVRSHLAPGDHVSFVVSIEDAGLGMTEDETRAANALLAEAPEVDLRRATTLGFHVVARLARRYGIMVTLVPTPGAGVTALVAVPAELLSERPVGTPAPSSGWNGGDRYQRAARAWTRGQSRTRPARHRVADGGARPTVVAAAADAIEATNRAEPPAGVTGWTPAPVPPLPPKPAWWWATQPAGAETEPAADEPAATTGGGEPIAVPPTPIVLDPPPVASPPEPATGAPVAAAESLGAIPLGAVTSPPAAAPDPSPAWWAVLVDP